MLEGRQRPDLLRALSSYLIPIILVIVGLAVAREQLIQAQVDIKSKVGTITHKAEHNTVNLRINHVEQEIAAIAQRVETYNYQAQQRHDKALNQILVAIKK